MDDEAVKVLVSMTGVSMPENLDSKMKKQKAKEAVEWLRNNDVKLEDFPNESLKVLERLAPASSIGRKDRNALSAIEWLRNNEARVDDMDDSAVEVFANLTGVAAPRKMTVRSRK